MTNELQSPFTVIAGPDNSDIPAQLLGKWQPKWTLDDRGGLTRFDGAILGYGSSRRAHHNHDISSVGFENAEPGVGARGRHTRCPACRWSEIRIFRAQESPNGEDNQRGRYVIHTLGVSLIQGETTRVRTQWAQTGFEVVECATVRRGDGGSPFLPATHARALAMASGFDDDIADAYVNRAVA